MKAVIFCGGQGTRMRPLTDYIQKTMIPIGEFEKPLLEYIVRLLTYNGFNDFVFLTGYKRNQIENYFGNGSRFNCSIAYVDDDPNLKGTGGAILNAQEQIIKDNADGSFLVYYGDIISDFNLKKMYDNHLKKGKMATVILSPEFQIPVGVAEMEEDGTVTSFVEKPILKILANTGIAILKSEFFQILDREKTKGQKMIDLNGELIPELAKKGEVNGFVTASWWYDVGSLDKVAKLPHSILNSKLKHLFE
ncbi:MAG: nucleotidyltransferase family protein [Candidatus Kariarchaeaceae archaeon]